MRFNSCSNDVIVSVHNRDIPLVHGHIYNWFMGFQSSRLVNAFFFFFFFLGVSTFQISFFSITGFHSKSTPRPAVWQYFCMKLLSLHSQWMYWVRWLSYYSVWWFIRKHVCSTSNHCLKKWIGFLNLKIRNHLCLSVTKKPLSCINVWIGMFLNFPSKFFLNWIPFRFYSDAWPNWLI